MAASVSYAEVKARITSIKNESDTRIVTLHNGEKVELKTTINYAFLNTPQKGALTRRSRIKAFAGYMAGRMDDVWKSNSDASVEFLVLPRGNIDQVFDQINNIYSSKRWMNKRYRQIMHRIRGDKMDASHIIKDEMAWENLLKYDPNMPSEDVKKLPDDLFDGYLLAHRIHTGKEHILIGNFRPRPMERMTNILATIRFFVNGAVVHASTLYTGVLAPDATSLHASMVAAPAAFFGAAMQKNTNRVSNFVSKYKDFKIIDKMGLSHDASHEVQYLLRQSVFSLSFITLLSAAVVGVNHYFDLNAAVTFEGLMSTGVKAAGLSMWAGYGFQKFIYDRHNHETKPSPRNYSINARNEINIFMLNLFVTVGQISYQLAAHGLNPEVATGSTVFLGVMGATGLMTYLKFGKNGLARKYQNFEENLRRKMRGGKYESAVSWVKRETRLSSRMICHNIFSAQ